VTTPHAGAPNGEAARIGPFDTTIDAAYARCYAQALRVDNSRYLDGTAVPPLVLAARIFPGQWAAMDLLVPSALARPAQGGVHASHDVRLLRPIEVGEPLLTYVELHSARPTKNNARVVTRHITLDAAQQPVVEQLWTTLLFDTTCDAAGPDTPDHRLPEDARSRPIFGTDVTIDMEMARLYAEVSQDFSAHHFDLQAARNSGFDRLFLHGLCTMGLCAEAAVSGLAEGRSELITRVAVRFSSPAFIGDLLHIDMFEAEKGAYAFEAAATGPKVLSHGWIELRNEAKAVARPVSNSETLTSHNADGIFR
jgi:acyl dehydratase